MQIFKWQSCDRLKMCKFSGHVEKITSVCCHKSYYSYCGNFCYWEVCADAHCRRSFVSLNLIILRWLTRWLSVVSRNIGKPHFSCWLTYFWPMASQLMEANVSFVRRCRLWYAAQICSTCHGHAFHGQLMH